MDKGCQAFEWSFCLQLCAEVRSALTKTPSARKTARQCHGNRLWLEKAKRGWRRVCTGVLSLSPVTTRSFTSSAAFTMTSSLPPGSQWPPLSEPWLLSQDAVTRPSTSLPQLSGPPWPANHVDLFMIDSAKGPHFAVCSQRKLHSCLHLNRSRFVSHGFMWLTKRFPCLRCSVSQSYLSHYAKHLLVRENEWRNPVIWYGNCLRVGHLNSYTVQLFPWRYFPWIAPHHMTGLSGISHLTSLRGVSILSFPRNNNK